MAIDNELSGNNLKIWKLVKENYKTSYIIYFLSITWYIFLLNLIWFKFLNNPLKKKMSKAAIAT